MKDRINIMSDFIHHHPEHVLFVLLLISQISHLGTTNISRRQMRIVLYYFVEGIAEGAASGFSVFAIAMGINHTSFYLAMRRNVLAAGFSERVQA
jgi:hypothetical protein